MSNLAINGGPKVREKLFPAHRPVGIEEAAAVAEVMAGGVLSKYLGAWHKDFYGGPTVKALEKAWAERFGSKHAVAVNSNTSGLICAMGAVGIEPGDEVIVSGYSMSISAVAPMFYGGVPVFADLEDDCFCLSTKSVAEKITPRTKAILVVDLFGQVYDATAMNALAVKHGIKVVEDCAQAPGARLDGTYSGALGDIGVFSMNYHKHIHSGEGGIIVTDDDDLAEKMRMIRNHAESVIGPRSWPGLTNMLGFNFRMTEVEAAIALSQLDKLDGLLAKRLENVAYIEQELAFISALTPPKVRDGARHVYYQHAYLWDEDAAGIDRNTFVEAVKAELPMFELRETEGVKLGYGYVRPLYKLPIFQEDPRTSNFTRQLPDYSDVTCPVLEELHHKTLVHHEFMVPSMNRSDIDDVVAAFDKVWSARNQLGQKSASWPVASPRSG